MPEVIDWQIAEKVAVRATGSEPFSKPYHYASLQPDFARFTAQADPHRHLKSAQLLGADISGAGPEDAGDVLANQLGMLR